ncbi:MAG: cytochrome c oxidase assembly protein [Chloroflexi bacterium]|nr:cytochrome c oxidase assembly protein [Chloroflexota bacterium]
MSLLLSLTALAQAATAAAQAGPSAIPPFTWSSWSGDGVLRGGLLLLAGVYLLGVGPLRKQYRLGPPASKGQIALYLSGVFCLLVALEGPIHELSDTYLFSAHMVQHMLLIYAAPPLMLLGMPGWLLRPVLRLPGVMRLARGLTNPFVALLGFNLVFSLYHIPLYYNAVVADHRLHVAAHLVFIVLAVMTWWPILSPLSELPRLSYPLQMLYVFAQTFSGFIVGSFITNARTILYTFYLDAPRTWGLSPQDDQQLGGLIMWIVGGFYLLIVYSVIFFAWANAEGVHDDVAVPIRPRPRRAVPGQVTGGDGQAAAGQGRNGQAAGEHGVNGQGASGQPATAAGSSVRSGAPSDEGDGTRQAAGSPLDLGARHVVTSAPDRSRLN